jgi:hypothetical protein
MRVDGVGKEWEEVSRLDGFVVFGDGLSLLRCVGLVMAVKKKVMSLKTSAEFGCYGVWRILAAFGPGWKKFVFLCDCDGNHE